MRPILHRYEALRRRTQRNDQKLRPSRHTASMQPTCDVAIGSESKTMPPGQVYNRVLGCLPEEREESKTASFLSSSCGGKSGSAVLLVSYGQAHAHTTVNCAITEVEDTPYSEAYRDLGPFVYVIKLRPVYGQAYSLGLSLRRFQPIHSRKYRRAFALLLARCSAISKLSLMQWSPGCMFFH